MRHVQKWYCIDCKDELEQEAEENKGKDEDGEEDEEDVKWSSTPYNWGLFGWKFIDGQGNIYNLI